MRFLISIIFLGASIAAQAQETTNTTPQPTESHRSAGGLALEPMIIYSQDNENIRTSQLPLIPSDTSGTSRSAGFGLKIGGHIGEVVVLGADARYAKSEMSDSSYGTARGDKYTLGPVLGVQMPVAGLRLWGTYVLAGDYDPEAGAQGFDLRFKDPRGYRVGVGLHVGPVSLNLEYEDLTFQNTQIQSFGLGNATADSSVDFSSRGYLASLSFPLEF